MSSPPCIAVLAELSFTAPCDFVAGEPGGAHGYDEPAPHARCHLARLVLGWARQGAGHDVGSHTVPVHLARSRARVAHGQIVRASAALEDVTGSALSSACYSHGEFNAGGARFSPRPETCRPPGRHAGAATRRDNRFGLQGNAARGGRGRPSFPGRFMSLSVAVEGNSVSPPRALLKCHRMCPSRGTSHAGQARCVARPGGAGISSGGVDGAAARLAGVASCGQPDAADPPAQAANAGGSRRRFTACAGLPASTSAIAASFPCGMLACRRCTPGLSCGLAPMWFRRGCKPPLGLVGGRSRPHLRTGAPARC